MLEVTKRDAGGVVVVGLAGSIDGSDSCRQIHQAFKGSLTDGHRKFVIDLGAVEWINSLGVGFLVASAVSASREGATVHLTGLSTRVDTVLRACGIVPHVWQNYADEAAAIASFA
jgi:anti-anti-sigma factor